MEVYTSNDKIPRMIGLIHDIYNANYLLNTKGVPSKEGAPCLIFLTLNKKWYGIPN